MEGGGQPPPEKQKETGKSHCVHGTHLDAFGNRTVAELRPVKSVHEANPAKHLQATNTALLQAFIYEPPINTQLPTFIHGYQIRSLRKNKRQKALVTFLKKIKLDMFSRFFIDSKKPAPLFLHFLLVSHSYLGHQKAMHVSVGQVVSLCHVSPWARINRSPKTALPTAVSSELTGRAATALRCMLNATISFCRKSCKPFFF